LSHFWFFSGALSVTLCISVHFNHHAFPFVWDRVGASLHAPYVF
jgi:hypothetical protein